MNEIRIGDCLEIMKLLILGNVKVQTCITSPPYFGLRDYGTAQWEGGNVDCDHTGVRRPGEGDKSFTNGGPSRDKPTNICRGCGAVRIDSQIGLEETPAAYVARLVEVFRLVRDLLADDGTLWLNLGDSYVANRGNTKAKPGLDNKAANGANLAVREWKIPGKAKDLIGIPWRVAFALQADGWYLRSDIIWAKPNPMPESVTDRPTKSHEYLFLLSKSAEYFYDADAIREPHLEESIKRAAMPWNGNSVRNHPSGNGQLVSGGRAEGAPMNTCHPNGRNKRSVWMVCTQAYDGAHFATFPPDLILPCVLAGSRPGDVVFDPFMGSGTTALVAKENGRRYLGCELNPEYRALWESRLAQEVLFGPEVPE